MISDMETVRHLIKKSDQFFFHLLLISAPQIGVALSDSENIPVGDFASCQRKFSVEFSLLIDEVFFFLISFFKLSDHFSSILSISDFH